MGSLLMVKPVFKGFSKDSGSLSLTGVLFCWLDLMPGLFWLSVRESLLPSL